MRKRYNDLPYDLIEKCLYHKKYLPDKIAILETALNTMFPNTSTSIVKLGQGSTKTPFDTSITERWGIKRADCEEAKEWAAKRKLLFVLNLMRDSFTVQEDMLVNCKYGRELSPHEIQRELHIARATYFRLKNSVVKKAWSYLHLIEKELPRALK